MARKSSPSQKKNIIMPDDKLLDKELKALAKKNNAAIYPISPDDVIVGDWVRWKCLFGCKGYGKHLSCPPYVPGPDDTRRLLKDYKKAYLIHFHGIPGMDELDAEIGRASCRERV